MSMPRPLRLSFVDLETTGATATSDGITEIGIVELDENGVREWSTLINPGQPISSFIQSLTGISNEMVATAPRFEEVADELQARLAGRLFVAHNARFDHGFLKNAFKRTGHVFRPDVLCTVRLSRKLYPAFARHNLDAISERHRLRVADRHRALGDARLLWQFWEAIARDHTQDHIHAAVAQLTKRSAVPSHIDEASLADLPAQHGVYVFHGENDSVLYVGKANHIRKRVMSHFTSDSQSDKELEISQQLRRIDWHLTGGEIGALLLEAQLVKQHSPSHNVLLRKIESVCAWRVVTRDGVVKLKIVTPDDLFFAQDEQLYGPFASPANARAALRQLADEHALCGALLKLDKAKAGAPCFASQVGKCLGVCCGREEPVEHATRLIDALQALRLQPWPYSSAAGIHENGRIHVLDGWAYLGSAENAGQAQALADAPRRHAAFDRDVYAIARKYLAKAGTEVSVYPFTEPLTVRPARKSA